MNSGFTLGQYGNILGFWFGTKLYIKFFKSKAGGADWSHQNRFDSYPRMSVPCYTLRQSQSVNPCTMNINHYCDEDQCTQNCLLHTGYIDGKCLENKCHCVKDNWSHSNQNGKLNQ